MKRFPYKKVLAVLLIAWLATGITYALTTLSTITMPWEVIEPPPPPPVEMNSFSFDIGDIVKDTTKTVELIDTGQTLKVNTPTLINVELSGTFGTEGLLDLTVTIEFRGTDTYPVTVGVGVSDSITPAIDTYNVWIGFTAVAGTTAGSTGEVTITLTYE